MHRSDEVGAIEAASPLSVVMERELHSILAGASDAEREGARETLWGLALSGGGIRSATFALGVLQALTRCGAIRGFHYLSTVSGGGYIGAFLQAAIRRYGLNGACDLLTAPVNKDDALAARQPGPPMPSNRPLRHLREYSNYLSPNTSALSGDTLGMLATYLRNVLLIQLQLLALMLAFGVLPLWAFPLLQWLGANPAISLPLAAALALAASIGLARVSAGAQRAQVASDRPGTGAAARAGAEGEFGRETPSPAVGLASNLIVLLLASASAIGALGVFGLQGDRTLPSACVALGLQSRWSGCVQVELGAYTLGAYASVWLTWLVLDRLRPDSNAEASPLQRHRLRFLFGTLAAAVLAGALVLLLRELAPGLRLDATWSALIWGSPLVFLAVVSTAAVHTGLAGDALSDLQREIWARVGGRSGALVLVGICGSLGLLVIGPWLVGRLLYSGDGLWSRLVGLGGIASWLLVTFAGVAASARVSAANAVSQPYQLGLRRALAAVAPWIFVLGLWVVIGLLAQSLLMAMGAGPVPALVHDGGLGDYFQALSRLAADHHALVSILMLGGFGLWLLFGLLMDGNELSLNAFYRNRLVRCYLGATNAERRPESITNFDPGDDLPLHDLVGGGGGETSRPLYPLIGTTLNLVSSKQLDWQDRRAASFLLSPHYCGHLPPVGRGGAQAVGDPPELAGSESLAHRLGLGTAVAISGAAVSPNMGARSSPAITFLLTLFDARLGWWLPNRIVQQRIWGHRAALDKPPFPGMQLLAELLGLTHGNGSFVHVSDGGHFENLGIYELVRRRCRFILCSDAGADPKREFADLANAIQKCRVDFGAHIAIDIDELRPDPGTGRSRRHATLGHIDYADGTRGLLLYLKPTLVGDEDADIQHYARLHPEFPHQPTADQYFDEAQFESYRQLGEHIGKRVFASTLERIGDGCTRGGLALRNSDTKERLLTELAHRFYAPLDLVGRNFSRHGEAMARLFATLRGSPALASLDLQFYPGWSLAPGQGRQTAAAATGCAGMPAPHHFRDCFYFCQELIQLMESVYIDLDLDANWQHPDNRGWMNVFRHWSWSATFRVAWALSAQTFGSRFVGFCEARVGIPRMVDAVGLEPIDLQADKGLAEQAATLHEDGKINAVELGVLGSAAVAHSGPAHRLYRLRLHWSHFLAEGGDRTVDPSLGIALVQESTLLLFRIQDHVRRLGLGSVFMRRLLAVQSIDKVAIAGGDYGPVGLLSDAEREAMQAQLSRMLRDARLRIGALR